ncbi:MAG: hypothetical protein FJ246_07725 [Nitrospira sp.]|nr:hypothetical protein [Nitrospira sp.]
MVSRDLEGVFPRLRDTGYIITSPSTPDYNCIAWAAGETNRWWWPVRGSFAYWPSGAPLQETLEAFVQAFAALGFAHCDDPRIEDGFEKIAIYIDDNGQPTHAARQLPTGRWTSKLGKCEDIEHELEGLTASCYGSVARILKRPVRL